MIVEEPKQLPMTRKKSWFEMMEEEVCEVDTDCPSTFNCAGRCRSLVEYNDKIVVSRHPTAYRKKATSASSSDTVSPVSQKKKRGKLSTTLRVFEATYFDETYVQSATRASNSAAARASITASSAWSRTSTRGRWTWIWAASPAKGRGPATTRGHHHAPSATLLAGWTTNADAAVCQFGRASPRARSAASAQAMTLDVPSATLLAGKATSADAAG